MPYYIIIRKESIVKVSRCLIIQSVKMDRIKKNVLRLLTLLIIVGTFFGANVSAEESYTEVPSKMSPGAEVVYRDGKYVVVSGSTVKESFEGKMYGLGDLVEGMRIIYATDGYMFDIEYPEGAENPLIKKQKAEPTIIPFSVVYPGYWLMSKWGTNNRNQLYISNDDKNAMGKGRATTFSDQPGQGNIVLKKGDCATKLAYANVLLGTKVSITHVGKTVTFIKNDAGGMPDAIVDIWKTGVEYFGYKWTKTFSMPNPVTIKHAYVLIEED